jgi:hypothetical protein
MGYKRSTDDIDSPKVDAAISISATSTITANGERGTLSFTLNAGWDHDDGFGAGNTLFFLSDKIMIDSCITLSLQNDVKSRLYVLTHEVGKAIIVPINYSGSTLASGQVVKINYRISN